MRPASSPARGVDIRVGTTLASLDARAATLSDGTRLPTRTLVWTAGVRAHPQLAQFGLPLDDRGRVLVDETLRVEDREDVWALGDGAHVPNAATPDHPDPPTCQHALRQARRLAKNLRGDVRPYRYRMLGQVATLGRYKGIADVMGYAFAAFSAGSSAGRITSTSSPCSHGSSASSSTGRWRSSSGATSPSSRCSDALMASGVSMPVNVARLWSNPPSYLLALVIVFSALVRD